MFLEVTNWEKQTKTTTLKIGLCGKGVRDAAEGM